MMTCDKEKTYLYQYRKYPIGIIISDNRIFHGWFYDSIFKGSLL